MTKHNMAQHKIHSWTPCMAGVGVKIEQKFEKCLKVGI